MRSRFYVCLFVFSLCCATEAYGHGFGVTEVRSGGAPVGLTVTSQSQVLDGSGTPAPYTNLFLDTFSNVIKPDSLFTEGSLVSTPRSSPGSYYPANGGNPQTSGPFSAFDFATFTVTSPLYFSNGGPAVLAPAGVSLNLVERFPGNAPNGASNVTNHPGAATTADGLITISGATGVVPGFNISIADTHEIVKDLFLGANTATGEYGFAYTITVHYTGGPTLTTGPLVSIFALTDPTLTGGSFRDAPLATQGAATLAIYNAAVPEPSTMVLGAVAFAFLGACQVYRRQRNVA